MNRRSFLLGAAALAFCGALMHSASGGSKGSTLEVHVTYTGAGTVDEAHRFYVAVWDTPAFVTHGGASKPIGTARVMSKAGTVSFDDIQKTPVFVSMAYDATGKWIDPSSDVPPGTALGFTAKSPALRHQLTLSPARRRRFLLSWTILTRSRRPGALCVAR